jgi:hypothetical protein
MDEAIARASGISAYRMFAIEEWWYPAMSRALSLPPGLAGPER